MHLIRGLLLDNLGLKLAALLMALLVYLNVYTDRPADMVVSFPVLVTDLADSLSIAGAPLPPVQAELRGTGKQLIRMRLTEPSLKLSLAGVNAGQYERRIGPADLPLESGDGLQIERLIGPVTLAFQVERKISRNVPVAPRVNGVPAGGASWTREAFAEPESVRVTGPRSVVVGLDSVVLRAVRIDGRHDTLRVQVSPFAVPASCSVEPPLVRVVAPITRAAP